MDAHGKKEQRKSRQKPASVRTKNEEATMRRKYTAGTNADVEIWCYDGVRYVKGSEVSEVKKYTIDSWEIVDGDDAKEIESMAPDCREDDYHEYLIINLSAGGRMIFRNSYVDMFRR